MLIEFASHSPHITTEIQDCTIKSVLLYEYMHYYTPVFRRDVLWFIRPSSDGTYYGMVMSVRVSVCPSVRLSVRPPVFPHFLLHALTYIELKFYTWLCFHVLQIKFECHHFASIFEGVLPPCEKYTVFRTFLLHALTYWAEILHMTLFWCTTEQVRVSSLCVNFWRSCASLWT